MAANLGGYNPLKGFSMSTLAQMLGQAKDPATINAISTAMGSSFNSLKTNYMFGAQYQVGGSGQLQKSMQEMGLVMGPDGKIVQNPYASMMPGAMTYGAQQPYGAQYTGYGMPQTGAYGGYNTGVQIGGFDQSMLGFTSPYTQSAIAQSVNAGLTLDPNGKAAQLMQQANMMQYQQQMQAQMQQAYMQGLAAAQARQAQTPPPSAAGQPGTTPAKAGGNNTMGLIVMMLLMSQMQSSSSSDDE